MSYRTLLPLVALLVALVAPAAWADIAPWPPRPKADVAPQPPSPKPDVEVLPGPGAPVVADVPPLPVPGDGGGTSDLVWPVVGGSAAVLIGVGLFFGLRRRNRDDE